MRKIFLFGAAYGVEDFRTVAFDVSGFIIELGYGKFHGLVF